MSMTPERIEEHTEFVEKFGKLPGHMALELLAALEESQQQVEDFKSQRDHYRSECRKLNLLVKEQHEAIQSLRVTGNKVEYELAEAQQTIAQQSEALGWYELGKPELARAALGNKKGSDKA